MTFSVLVPVRSYRAARRRYPRAAVICRADGGYRAFASLTDYRTWRKQT